MAIGKRRIFLSLQNVARFVDAYRVVSIQLISLCRLVVVFYNLCITSIVPIYTRLQKR